MLNSAHLRLKSLRHKVFVTTWPKLFWVSQLRQNMAQILWSAAHSVEWWMWSLCKKSLLQCTNQFINRLTRISFSHSEAEWAISKHIIESNVSVFCSRDKTWTLLDLNRRSLALQGLHQTTLQLLTKGPASVLGAQSGDWWWRRLGSEGTSLL